jgi:hypothetical protein
MKKEILKLLNDEATGVDYSEGSAIYEPSFEGLAERLEKLYNIYFVIKAKGEPLRSCNSCKNTGKKGLCIDCTDWKYFERNGL